MNTPIRPHIESPMASAVLDLIAKLGAYLPEVMPDPLVVTLAGGAAVSMYAPDRSSNDVDAIFSKRVLLPDDIIIQGPRGPIAFDTQYSPTLGLEAEGYEDRAIFIADLANGRIRVMAVEPNDLAIMKLGRFGEQDRKDIEELADLGLLNADVIEERATDALVYYIGNTSMVALNIRDAVEAIRERQTDEALIPKSATKTNMQPNG